MKFSNIIIDNFRQYYGIAEFDMSTQDNQNIVLIGGRNGYGKTNFLLAIVWCLYGDKIVQVDENFKKEIQKEKNYSIFIQQSLNWTAQKEGKDTFSVTINIDDLELVDDNLGISSKNVIIKRSRNTFTSTEHLSIIDSVTNKEIFVDNEDDKFNFINDYIIPIDAAKFVFFDAEKISEIANLSIKDEGSFINDALGKILGLDIYETLIEDFEFYINTLKKEGASKGLQEQIIDRESSIELSTLQINKYEEEKADILKELDELKKRIREYDTLIAQNSKNGNTTFDRITIVNELESLKIKEIELSNQFNDLSEIIPLIILSGKLEEIKEHLQLQNENDQSDSSSKDNSRKIEEFIELLFNKPPDPEESTMSFKDKLFYYEKAKRLSDNLFSNDFDLHELSFEHDLNNSDRNLIFDTLNEVNTQSSDVFQKTIEEFNQINLKRVELEKTLIKIDEDLEDEIILEYIAEKETAEHKIALNNRKIGENDQLISKLKKDISRFNQELITLRSKVEMNEQNRIKIKETEKYINVLNLFLEEQKNKHKSSLERSILAELKLLMHKLSSENNSSKFIEDVQVSILASGQGMMITLLDQDDEEIRKESLSSGEKQIYISCLIKAILNESIQSLPIFIDTPLGRLDEEHRDSITKKYYPALSEQVVLFSTNSEITPKRYKDISGNVARSYLLVNDGTNTSLKNGYFNTVGND